MNVTDDISWNRAFAPAPIVERPGKEFEFAAWCGEAAFDFTIDTHTGKATAFTVAVGARNRNDVWRCGLRRSREHAPEMVFANVIELFRGNIFFVERTGLFLDLESAVTTHELER